MAEKLSKTDPGRAAAWQELQSRRDELEQWRGLHEAWKARGFSIKELVALYVAQYFTVDSRGPRHDAPPRVDYSSRQDLSAPDGAGSRPRRRA